MAGNATGAECTPAHVAGSPRSKRRLSQLTRPQGALSEERCERLGSTLSETVEAQRKS